MGFATPGPARARGVAPAALVTTIVALALAVPCGLFVHPAAGAAVLGFAFLVLVRPLDLFAALLLAAAAAAFAAYGDPGITRDLAIVAGLGAYALLCFAAAVAARRWGMPRSPLTAALLAFAVTTGVAVIHGLAAGNPTRYVGLEVFALLGLGCALGVGGLQLQASHLRLALWTVVGVGLVSAAIGLQVFAVTGTRTQGMAFSPIPGLVALVLLNLALHDPGLRPRGLWGPTICLLLLHQVISFTRGYWLALLAGGLFTCALYVRAGAGARARWTRLARTLAGIAVLVGVGLVVLRAWLGWTDVLGMVGGRFLSSFETRNTPETVSNIVRLVELRKSLDLIGQSPWLGHGHGSQLIVRQFFYPETGPQWWVHQSFLMIWIKQGGIGLLALLAVLFAALRLGIRGARTAAAPLRGWCAAAATATVFVLVLGLTNYYFFMVTQNYLLAVLWGIALAAAAPSRRALVWRDAPPAPAGAGERGRGG